MSQRPVRRMGGRAARRQARTSALPSSLKPVNPGLESGRFLPLLEHELEAIHEQVLKVLEEIGLADAIPSCIEVMTAQGCKMSDQGRLLIPRKVVEQTLERSTKQLTLHGQNPEHDMDLSGTRIHFGTAGAAVHIVESTSRNYRDSTLNDLYDLARLCDKLEHIHFFSKTHCMP